MLNRKTRFITTLVLLVTGGLLLTSVVSYLAAQRSLATQIADSTLPLTSDNVYSEIQRDLLRPIFISSLMARDTFVRDWVIGGELEAERMVRYLKEIREQYQAVTSFFVSERTRIYYHTSGIHRTVDPANPRDAWYYRVRDLHDDYEINVDFDEVNRDRMTIFINYRVHDYAGNYLGATGVGLAMDSVGTLLETYQRRYGRRIYFVDRVGQVTLRGAGYDGPEHLRDDPGMSVVATRLLTSPSGSYTIQRDTGKVFVNSRLVPEFGWYLVIEQAQDLAASPALRTLLLNLAICLVISAVVLYLANLTLSAYQRRLEELASTDKLTGLVNRQAFDLLAEQAQKGAARRAMPLTLAICDIDDFKQINDAYGHLAGDAVIRAVAQLIRQSARDVDIVCRWGGEEFLVLLVDCDLVHGAAIAERIRRTVGTAVVPLDSHALKLTVSISIGLAAQRDGESYLDLVKHSDEALYTAKHQGKNRVALAT